MPSDEQAIRDLFHAWQRATIANDRAAMRRLMADDVLFMTVGRPPLRGPDAFVDLMPEQPPDHIDFDQQILEISIHGDWAYAICLLNVTITPRPGLEPMRRTGNTLTLFRKLDTGAWVLARDANLMPPPAPPPARAA